MRYDRDLPSRFHTSAPTASPAALAAAPDTGTTVLVIPVQLRTRGSLREANLKFLLSFYAKRVPALVVVEQILPGRRSSLKELTGSFAPTVHYLNLEVESDLIQKCRLVNIGARYAFDSLDARYVWQVDADIFVHSLPVIRNLSILNSVSVPVIKPFLHFARLSAEASLEILHLSDALADAYEPPSPSDDSIQFETLVGPGSMIFSRYAFSHSGGMDESYSGWGWEDIEFAERLAADLPVHTFPFRAVHLFHEEDRQRNEENASLFFQTHRQHLPPAEKARILAHTSFWNLLRKTCLIHLFGDFRARIFEEFFANHPETTHCFDLLDLGDLQRAHLPDAADGIIEHLAEALGEARTPCASIAIKFPFGEAGETILKILIASGFRIVFLSWEDSLCAYLEDRPELVARISNSALSASDRLAIQEDVNSLKLLRRRFLKMLSTVAATYRLGIEDIAIEPSLGTLGEGYGRIDIEEIRRFLGFEKPYHGWSTTKLGERPPGASRILDAAKSLQQT